eukprot:TRINITY_DN12506_c0_g2_i18.p1 TRINITY_DN12506_c0_g2~~TRINITY_DN12506_c0_g2_i18.p1  ORF type:complete len:975 (+),score=156.28 TRINITY_DN12506_c0_g2_i18:81-2927(+)
MALSLAWTIGFVATGAAAYSLADNPVIGDKVVILDGTWTLTAPTAAIQTTGEVPGDLLTDLERSRLIGDPLYELNFKNHSLWTDHAWTYSTTFASTATSESTLLVFDGIKMGANITLNGHFVGLAVDQFLRYQYDVTKMLLAGTNELSVTFDFDVQVDGRFMACTGGWDWAPYSDTSQSGARTFSQGIWKSVYLIQVSTAAITHAVPHVFYNGEHPVSRLQEHNHSGFRVEATATGSQVLYDVTFQFVPSLGPSVSTSRRIGFRTFALVTGNDTNPGYVARNKNADGNDHQGMLWRVNGMVMLAKGANMIPMEELEGRMSAEAHRRLVISAREAGMNTLRVWGGGIFYPQVWYDACDELGIMIYHDMAYAQIGHSPTNNAVQDAELRHQIRRISYHPSILMYDGCNECKVVLNTPTGIYATFVMTVVAEEDRSRPVWPSCPAAGWDAGVNRLTGLPNDSAKGLLPAGTLPYTPPAIPNSSKCSFQANVDYDAGTHWKEPVVEDKDECCNLCFNEPDCFVAAYSGGRCYFKHPHPTPSFRQGVISCWPKGHGPIPPPPPSPPPKPPIREVHGPYQHGSGFPAVDGTAQLVQFDPNIPITIQEVHTGPQFENVFASEFGCVGMSSFESMAPTLAPEHWGVHGGGPPDECAGGFEKTCNGSNVMAQRNYPCDSIIYAYFGNHQDLNATGEAVFKKQLYQCMLGQALNVKSDVETRRSTNQFGLLIWQYNEIWPTGGWGSIEYGSARQGQVVGGRWKPLQYLYKASIMTDVTLACSLSLCYVKNDSPFPFHGRVMVDVIEFATGLQSSIHAGLVDLAAGAGVSTFFAIETSGYNASQHVMVGKVYNGTANLDELVCNNVIAMTPPASMKLPLATVTFEVDDHLNADGSVDITLQSDRVAMYVTLTTLAQGRFSDNAFIIMPGKKTIRFLPYENFDLTSLRSTLRAEHLANNL